MKYLVLAKNHVPGVTLGAAATPQHFAQRFRTQQQIPGAFLMPFLAFPFVFYNTVVFPQRLSQPKLRHRGGVSAEASTVSLAEQ